MNKLKNLNVAKELAAIEADAGLELPGLKEALKQAKSGKFNTEQVHTPLQILVRQARKQTGRTQPDFAKALGVGVTSIRDWEQGRHEPQIALIKMMKLILKKPKFLDELEAV